MSHLIHTVDEVTASWLGAVLGDGAIDSVQTVAVGTGQMSQSHLVTYTRAGDPGSHSVVVKLASDDPGSRAAGIGLGIYNREIQFYRTLAQRIGGPVPACHYADLDERDGWFTLVLETIAPAHQGDQIAGCDVEQARLAMEVLAELHAPVFGDAQVAALPWLNAPSLVNQALLTQLLPAFVDRYGAAIADEHRAVTEDFVARADAWIAERPQPWGLVHADYRLDNMLFGEPGGPRPLTVVDWQTVGWGSPMLDAAYFLSGGLTVEDRRAHEQELVGVYHDALLARGVTGFTWEQCWREYRRVVFHGILMAVAASMLVQRTERGDEMFTTMFARHAQQAIDLDCTELLPEAGAAPAALIVDPLDEGDHPPTGEQLWNESWYFDAIDDGAQLGVYVRIGAYPNLGVSWYTAYVCGPDRETVAIVDFAAPLPNDDGKLAVETPTLAAGHVCETPLQRFRVTLAGTGASYADPSAPLRGEDGAPIDVELDLVWDTAGTPYGYRVATRYEIPCRVTGTISVGDETLTLNGTGQRDHSWGARDWWAMDWVWSAGELDDGTRLHGVQLRIPDMPEMGIGYVQAAADGLTELARVTATETVAANGLIEHARIELEPAGVHVDVDPLAFGPLRLVAPDGRIALFPRAMCRLRADDGRSGLAWVEWNLNQR